MVAVLALIFFAIAAAAFAFVAWPLRRATRGRGVLIAALATFMLGTAGGVYLLVGDPQLALRSIRPQSPRNLDALVSTLAWRIRKVPDDPRGWMLLGRGYLTLGDGSDAAGAFKQALQLTPPQARSGLYSAYGEALTMASDGTVTPQAEAAFRAALAGDPKDFAARFYLGEAYAARDDKAHALAMWKGLLADAPPGAPWREAVVDRVAMLSGAAPPSIAAMVQGLADRLKAHPNDPDGWRRLVKAYAVLGQTQKARDALADARDALAGHHAQLAALGAEARDLKLEK